MLLLSVASCTETDVTVFPSISEVSVNVSCESASLSAVVSGKDSNECGFFFWEDGKPQKRVTVKSSSDTIKYTMIDLIPDTDYGFCAFVNNGAFDDRSDSQSFRTKITPVPSFLSCTFSPDAFNANLSCKLSSTEKVTECGFSISKKDDNAISMWRAKEVSEDFNVNVLWLSKSTEYKCQAYFIVNGVEYDSDFQCFTTSDSPYSEPFWKMMLEKFDEDANGQMSEEEINSVTDIRCSSMAFSSIAGIEVFVNLKWLYCDHNNLSSLDLSLVPHLEKLFADGNRIQEIDLSQNLELNEVKLDDMPELNTIWLSQGQTVSQLRKDDTAVIKYKD